MNGVIRKWRGFVLRKIVQLTRALVVSIQAISSQGIVNRDTKIQDFLIKENQGRLQLLMNDFGLATFSRDMNLMKWNMLPLMGFVLMIQEGLSKQNWGYCYTDNEERALMEGRTVDVFKDEGVSHEYQQELFMPGRYESRRYVHYGQKGNQRGSFGAELSLFYYLGQLKNFCHIKEGEQEGLEKWMNVLVVELMRAVHRSGIDLSGVESYLSYTERVLKRERGMGVGEEMFENVIVENNWKKGEELFFKGQGKSGVSLNTSVILIPGETRIKAEWRNTLEVVRRTIWKEFLPLRAPLLFQESGRFFREYNDKFLRIEDKGTLEQWMYTFSQYLQNMTLMLKSPSERIIQVKIKVGKLMSKKGLSLEDVIERLHACVLNCEKEGERQKEKKKERIGQKERLKKLEEMRRWHQEEGEGIEKAIESFFQKTNIIIFIYKIKCF